MNLSRFHKTIIFIFLFLFYGDAGRGWCKGIEGDAWTDSLLSCVQGKDLGHKMVFFSSHFLGREYQSNTLVGGPDQQEELIYSPNQVDCFTFLDYLCALSLSSRFEEVAEKLATIRYKGGKVSYSARNHFFVQWLNNNQDHFNIITNSIEKAICRSKNLNKKADGTLWLAGIPIRQTNVCHLPRTRVFEAGKALFQSGDLVGFTTDLAGLDVTHTGLIITNNGKIVLRHASSKFKKVVDEDLLEYLARRLKCSGIIVARPRAE